MTIVFAQHITPRLDYIAKTILGSNVIITKDVHRFINSSLQKINYSTTKFDDESLWIKPYGLLEQKGIEPIDITCFDWNGITAFFKTNGDIPFDILSAGFYLLSRYEEYAADFKTDAYGNYHHENSIAFKNNFLHLPLINLWLKELSKQFKFQIPDSNFQIVPTYDIDIAFAYKHHSLIRNAGGFIKDIVQQRGSFFERLNVLVNNKKDPYNEFDWLESLHKKYQLQPIYFFLVAMHRSKYDKNAIYNSNGMLGLIKNLSGKHKIGIHPSYVSNNNLNILKKEIEFLASVAHQNISNSRQHYLQLGFPKTFETLITAGVTADYTMGYGTSNGFRASYCKPFFWYNLNQEKETTLLLHSFCYMDSNSIFEQQLSAENAVQEMLHYYNAVKNVNGNFVFIMHNHFLANQPQWQQWREAYVAFLQQLN